MKKHFVIIYSLLCAVAVSASDIAYRCGFGSGAWEPSEWRIVKSPRWSYVGSWNQHGDHISNKVPDDASEQDMLGGRAGETYTSMLLKQKFSDDVTISSTLSFDHRMAPLLVITSAYGKDAAGIPEHRDHFEVVLYDQGLNVWHHFYENGKPYWKKAAFLEGEFKPKQRYTLTVTIKFTKKGPVMTVSCNGKTFGYLDDTLPKKFYVGLTGCEGLNRFYDFCVIKH